LVRAALIFALVLVAAPALARSLDSDALGCAELRDIETFSKLVRDKGREAGAAFIEEVTRTKRCDLIPAGTTIVQLDTVFSQEAFDAVTRIRLREGAPPIWVLSATIALN
jgi:hypothetical protein